MSVMDKFKGWGAPAGDAQTRLAAGASAFDVASTQHDADSSMHAESESPSAFGTYPAPSRALSGMGTATAPTLFTSLGGSFESDANTVMLVGNNTDGDRAYDGVIDEVRVSSMSRSASWFATEYRNQSDPTTCYVISAPL